MSAADVSARPVVVERRSLVLTSILATVLVSAGWLIGLVGSEGTTSVTPSSLSLELPSGWAVVEETDSQVVLARPDIPRMESVTIYLPDSPEATGAVDSFLLTAPERLLLFSVDSADDQQVTFRYVRLDSSGGPDALMGGRFLVFDSMAAVMFTPLERLETALTEFEEIIDSVEQT